MLLPLFSHLTIQIPKAEIALLRFVVEGYDHLATLIVLDPEMGTVKIHFPSAEEDTIKEILKDFKVTYL